MVFIIILLSRRLKMSKKTLGVIVGVNGAVTTAAITIVGLVAPDKAPVIQGIISAVSACVDGICLAFIKNGALPNGQETEQKTEQKTEEVK